MDPAPPATVSVLAAACCKSKRCSAVPGDYRELHAETVQDHGCWDAGQSVLASEWVVYTAHKPLRVGPKEETDAFKWWAARLR